jgi:hypothetical protein
MLDKVVEISRHEHGEQVKHRADQHCKVVVGPGIGIRVALSDPRQDV